MLAAVITSQAARTRCDVRVTKPVRAIEDPDSVMRTGEGYGPITQVRVNKKPGLVTYCAHGSYCYPSTSIEIVGPCRIVAQPDAQYEPPDAEDWLHDVE